MLGKFQLMEPSPPSLLRQKDARGLEGLPHRG